MNVCDFFCDNIVSCLPSFGSEVLWSAAWGRVCFAVTSVHVCVSYFSKLQHEWQNDLRAHQTVRAGVSRLCEKKLIITGYFYKLVISVQSFLKVFGDFDHKQHGVFGLVAEGFSDDVDGVQVGDSVQRDSVHRHQLKSSLRKQPQNKLSLLRILR